MLGIDVYRYQTVYDWRAVRDHGVGFVYVKGTDGGGPAIARADRQVNGAKGVGLPVGLYHYAQFSPSPEGQADVLVGEVRRLGADDLPPALDLEAPFAPNQTARDFSVRFLRRLVGHGFHRVALYASTSFLAGIGADALFDSDEVLIWAASYGVNDGRRRAPRYGGRIDIHQYTSVGLVPGISGRVDLNESLTDVVGGVGGSGEDMTQEEHDALMEIRGQLRRVGEQTTVGASNGNWPKHTNFADTVADAASFSWKTWLIAGQLLGRPAADVDEEALAAELAERGFGGMTAQQFLEIVGTLRLVPAEPRGPA